MQPKAVSRTDGNILDSVDRDNNSNNAAVSLLFSLTKQESRYSPLISMIIFCPQDSHLYECAADNMTPKPVRPPPRPPAPPSVTSTKAAAVAGQAVCYLNSNTKTTVKVNDSLK